MRTFHYITNTAEHFANMTEHNRIFHYQIQPWLRRIRIQFIQRFLSKQDFYLALREIFTTSNRVFLAIKSRTGFRRLPTEFDLIKSVIRFLSERDFYFSLQDIFTRGDFPPSLFGFNNGNKGGMTHSFYGGYQIIVQKVIERDSCDGRCEKLLVHFRTSQNWLAMH